MANRNPNYYNELLENRPQNEIEKLQRQIAYYGPDSELGRALTRRLGRLQEAQRMEDNGGLTYAPRDRLSQQLAQVKQNARRKMPDANYAAPKAYGGSDNVGDGSDGDKLTPPPGSKTWSPETDPEAAYWERIAKEKAMAQDAADAAALAGDNAYANGVAQGVTQATQPTATDSKVVPSGALKGSLLDGPGTDWEAVAMEEQAKQNALQQAAMDAADAAALAGDGAYANGGVDDGSSANANAGWDVGLYKNFGVPYGNIPLSPDEQFAKDLRYGKEPKRPYTRRGH